MPPDVSLPWFDIFWEGFTLQTPPPKTCSTGRNTDTPCWPITLQIWPPYPKKANDAAARGSSPTVRHGWTAQAAGKHQHCDEWLLDFLAEGAETTVRDREENPELCPSCVSPHTHAVLRRV